MVLKFPPRTGDNIMHYVDEQMSLSTRKRESTKVYTRMARTAREAGYIREGRGAMVVYHEGKLNFRSMGPMGNTWLKIIEQGKFAANPPLVFIEFEVS